MGYDLRVQANPRMLTAAPVDNAEKGVCDLSRYVRAEAADLEEYSNS